MKLYIKRWMSKNKNSENKGENREKEKKEDITLEKIAVKGRGVTLKYGLEIKYYTDGVSSVKYCGKKWVYWSLHYFEDKCSYHNLEFNEVLGVQIGRPFKEDGNMMIRYNPMNIYDLSHYKLKGTTPQEVQGVLALITYKTKRYTTYSNWEDIDGLGWHKQSF